MSELALQLIAENKKTKDKSLDLGNCGLTQVPEEIGELVWLEELNFTNAVTSKLVGNDYYQHEESPNKSPIIINIRFKKPKNINSSRLIKKQMEYNKYRFNNVFN